VVTERLVNLHDELVSRLGGHEGRTASALYATAYHSVKRDQETTVELWTHVLSLGRSLPTLPLWLKGGLSVPVDLDGSYAATCERLRILQSPLRAAR
jgi:hypothetical protein